MTSDPTVVSFKYNECTEINKKHIKSLIRKVWHTNDNEDAHLKEYDVMCFCSYLGSQIAGYVGVISINITIKNNTYKLGALSCVCTDPEYQRHGIGSKTIRTATAWIINKGDFDIGLFTCDPECTEFYEKSGIWTLDDNLILKGNPRENVISSRNLQLNVMKALFSEKAKSNASDFTKATIILNLPDDQFI